MTIRALSRWLVILAIVAAVAIATRIAGGAGHFDQSAYFLAVIPALVWFGPRSATAVALLCGIISGPFTPLEIAQHESQATHVWIERLLFFASFTAIAATLYERLIQARREIEGARALVESQNRTLTDTLAEAREKSDEMERTFAQQSQMLAELDALRRLDAAILAGMPEERILHLLTDLIRQSTGCDIGSVIQYESPENHRLVLRAYDGIGPEDAAKQADLLASIHPGQGATGWALAHDAATSSPDVTHDSRYGPMTEDCIYRATIAAPIHVFSSPDGVIWAGWRRPREFDAADIQRMERLAAEASVVLRYSRQGSALRDITFETVTALAEAIENRDPYTGGHCARLVEYAELIARQMNLAEDEVEIVRYGAALHDAGKVGVPDRILKKTGPLTPDEWTELRLHPYIGGQLCKRVSFLRPMYPIVYHHHERYDGSGYPDGLRGEHIPLGARIVAVVDAYDAMTSDRPYRRAMTHEQAIAILVRGAGRQWDSAIIQIFAEALAGREAEAA